MLSRIISAIFVRFIYEGIIRGLILGFISTVISIFSTLFGAGLALIAISSLIQSVVIPTHVNAMVLNMDALIAMYLFVIVGGSMINLFNIVNYRNQQNWKTLIIVWLTSVVVIASTVVYLLILLEPNNLPSGVQTPIIVSAATMIATSLMTVVGVVLLTIQKATGNKVEL